MVTYHLEKAAPTLPQRANQWKLLNSRVSRQGRELSLRECFWGKRGAEDESILHKQSHLRSKPREHVNVLEAGIACLYRAVSTDKHPLPERDSLGSQTEFNSFSKCQFTFLKY